MERSRGLGDSIAKVARAIGAERVAHLVEKATGKPCGCKGRQEALNRAVPYRGGGAGRTAAKPAVITVTPHQLLRKLLDDRARCSALVAEIKNSWGDHNTHLVCGVLLEAGYPIIHNPVPRYQYRLLTMYGWRPLNGDDPAAGDLYFDISRQELGFVVDLAPGREVPARERSALLAASSAEIAILRHQ